VDLKLPFVGKKARGRGCVWSTAKDKLSSIKHLHPLPGTAHFIYPVIISILLQDKVRESRVFCVRPNVLNRGSGYYQECNLFPCYEIAHQS